MSENENTVTPTTLHAHVDTFQRDCDGGHGYDFIEGFSEDERKEEADANGVNDFSEIHFMERILIRVASPYAVAYGMTIKVDDDGIEVNETTDEGSRSASVRWCRDEHCDPSAKPEVFEEFAEAAGY